MPKIFKQIPGVYKMVNSISGNVYVGSTVNISKRIGRHKYTIKNNIVDNLRIKEDADKYGVSSFIFEIIEYCPVEKLKDREQYYFELLKPSYNIWPSVYSAKNRSYTPEQLDNFKRNHHPIKNWEGHSHKLIKAWEERRCRPDGIETLQMLNRIGKKHSEETKSKFSEARRGVPKSPEHIEKMKIARLGTKFDPIARKWVKKGE